MTDTNCKLSGDVIRDLKGADSMLSLPYGNIQKRILRLVFIAG